MRVRQNDGAAEVALAQQQPNQPPGGQRRQREQAAGEQRVVRILVAGLGHGGDEALAGVLADAHAHLFAQRDVFIPGLLQLAAPVGAMQDIVQRRYRFDHQKVADRGGLRRSDLPLIDEPQLGEEVHRVFTGAAHHPLHALLPRDGLQRHRHQRPQPFILQRRVYRQKTDRRLVVGIDVQPPDGDDFTGLVHHHLVMGHGVIGILFRTHRLVQRLAQHFPAKLVILLQFLLCYGYS